jgi:hypothetical protein
MARKANRGRGGGKKIPKVLMKETSVEIEDAEISMECDAEVSEMDEKIEVEISKIEEQGSTSLVDVLSGKGIAGVANNEVEGAVRENTQLEQKPLAQDWRNLFRTEKSLDALHYYAPAKENGKIVVKRPKEAIEEGISKWSPSLVGQFLDKHLPFFIVKRTVDSMWAQYGKMEVFLLENGLYLFRFADVKTRDDVMEAKLWHILNKPMILRKWTPGMQLLKISLSTVPIWIKIHNLPIEFWNSTCLSYVASGIGKPLCADSVTEEQLRIGFARVLVEVNVESEFPKEVEVIGVDGERVVVGIEYPWLPVKCKKCKKCKSFGHLDFVCPKVERQVWIPRNQKIMPKAVEPKTFPSIMAEKDEWNEVRSARRTPISKQIEHKSHGHWTNSFQLLARADGNIKSGRVRELDDASNSLQDVIEHALGEESEKLLLAKGKNKMGDDEEVLMRGFSPTV